MCNCTYANLRRGRKFLPCAYLVQRYRYFAVIILLHSEELFTVKNNANMKKTRIIIRHISNAIPAGKLAVITGDSLDGASFTFRRLHSDRDSVLEAIKSGASGSALFGTDENGVIVETVKVSDGHVATVITPDGDFSGWSVTAERDGEVSVPYLFNIPVISWLQNDSVCAGEGIRIFGQCFAAPDRFAEVGVCEDGVHGYGRMLSEGHGVSVFLRDSAGTVHELAVTEASCYEIRAAVPALAAEGACTLYVMNESSGAIAELETEVHPAGYFECAKKKDKLFNVVEYGAVGIIQRSFDYARDITYENLPDSAPGFQRALDAAGANGGGTVFVPNGRYHFYGPIFIPRGVRLAGEDPNRVWLELPLGMGPIDGWGDWKQGSAINVFIVGEGDFEIENLNIMSVYSPVVIGAPVNEGCRAKLGDDKFNHTPCYENLLDQTKDANNVIIRNCHIYQSPTYIEHRKADRTEPFFTSEYENARRGAQPVTNYGAIVNVWTAIAIKGTNITVENNVIEGGGDCLCIMGAQNCLIRNNTMVGGDMAGCMSFFSTSYNPDNSWRRQCRNIILEGNEFSIQSKTSRAIFWIMEEHANYYMAHNVIKPLYWHCDSEGFCFHIWSNHMLAPTKSFDGRRITFDMDGVYKQYGNAWGLMKDGKFIPGVFGRGCIYITGGTGIGTRIPIVSNDEDSVTMAYEPDCELDETSVVCLSDFKKFENTYIVENEVGALGRGIYYWGGTYSNVVDGNELCDNGGILMEDLSGCGDTWQSAGELFGQILNNRVYRGRAFYSNSSTIGVLGGTTHDTSVSVIIRGNVAEDDTTYVALPRRKYEDGSFSYRGIVFEDNLSRNSEYGTELGSGVSVVIRGAKYDNVKTEIADEGADLTVLDR